MPGEDMLTNKDNEDTHTDKDNEDTHTDKDNWDKDSEDTHADKDNEEKKDSSMIPFMTPFDETVVRRGFDKPFGEKEEESDDHEEVD